MQRENSAAASEIGSRVGKKRPAGSGNSISSRLETAIAEDEAAILIRYAYRRRAHRGTLRT